MAISEGHAIHTCPISSPPFALSNQDVDRRVQSGSGQVIEKTSLDTMLSYSG